LDKNNATPGRWNENQRVGLEEKRGLEVTHPTDQGRCRRGWEKRWQTRERDGDKKPLKKRKKTAKKMD